VPLSRQLVEDFKSRCVIPTYSFMEQLRNICKPSDNYKRLKKIQARGARKIDQELDVLGMIKFRRRAKIALSALFDQTEQYMTSKISEIVLSDHDSADS
jgi:hypothetical protein